MEKLSTEQPNLSENIKAEIASKIEHARQHAILETRLEEIQNRLDILKEQFVNVGRRTREHESEEDDLENEVLASSAVAETIPEYKEMLHQIATENGFSSDWVMDFLAHENAHSNVAEQTGHGTSYIVLYINNEAGKLVGLQPACITKPNLKWGPREALTKNIEVTEAPLHYDNKLSDSDVASIARDNELLTQIRDDLEAAS